MSTTTKRVDGRKLAEWILREVFQLLSPYWNRPIAPVRLIGYQENATTVILESMNTHVQCGRKPRVCPTSYVDFCRLTLIGTQVQSQISMRYWKWKLCNSDLQETTHAKECNVTCRTKMWLARFNLTTSLSTIIHELLFGSLMSSGGGIKMEVSPKDCASLGAKVMQSIPVTGDGIVLLRIILGWLRVAEQLITVESLSSNWLIPRWFCGIGDSWADADNIHSLP